MRAPASATQWTAFAKRGAHAPHSYWVGAQSIQEGHPIADGHTAGPCVEAQPSQLPPPHTHTPQSPPTRPAGLGRKGIYLYNLPETISAYKYLNVPSVSARFGTDPFFWNWAMWLTARLVPRNLLNDRDFVKRFAALSDPLVRSVDKLVGETVVSEGGGEPALPGSAHVITVQSAARIDAWGEGGDAACHHQTQVLSAKA